MIINSSIKFSITNPSGDNKRNPIDIAVYEIVSGTWFNENAELNKQKYHTYVHVKESLRSIKTKDYANHGIKLYDDVEFAPKFEEVQMKLEEFVAKFKAQTNIFVAHNGDAYDFSVWKEAMKNIGKELNSTWILFDSLPFLRFMLASSGDQNNKPGLDYLCSLFSVKVEKRHRSYDDAKALSEVIFKCVSERSQDFIGFILEYLHSVQLMKATLNFKGFGGQSSVKF